MLRLPPQRPPASWLSREIMPVIALPVLAMAASVTTPLWPAWQSRLHYGPAMTTVLFALYVCAMVPAAAAAPQVRDYLGTRRLVAGGVALAIGGTILLWLADSVVLLAAGRLVQGVAVGLVSGPLATAILAAAPQGSPGLARTIAVLLTAGAGTGPLMSGLLAGEDGTQPGRVFLVMCLLLGIAVIATLGIRDVDACPAGAGTHSAPRVPPGAMVSMLAWAIAYTVLAASPGFARAVLHSDLPLVIGAPAGLLLFASAGMQITGSRGSGTSGMRDGLAIMFPGLVLFAAVAWQPSLWLLCMSLIVIGLGHGLAFPAALQAASAGPPNSSSTSNFFTITYMGGVVPVLSVGLLAIRWDLVVAMTVFSVTAGLASLLMACRLTMPQSWFQARDLVSRSPCSSVVCRVMSRSAFLMLASTRAWSPVASKSSMPPRSRARRTVGSAGPARSGSQSATDCRPNSASGPVDTVSDRE
jgi:MFS family permease